jgi:SHS2 domain-containing protein
MPFRFLEEIATADVAFEAWGATAEELFIASAEALLQTMVAKPDSVRRREELVIRLDNDAPDLLLFAFLQELIYYKDARRLLLHADSVRIQRVNDSFLLEAIVTGEEIDSPRHPLVVDVKAVTLHHLLVEMETTPCRAIVVLDV